MPNSIPFLRDPRTNSNDAYQRVVTASGHRFDKPTVGGSLPRATKKMMRDYHGKKVRETGWNQYVVPISFNNERVHSSQRIPFEKI